MSPLTQALAERAVECGSFAKDIDLVRPETYEGDPTPAALQELLGGLAAIYELRFRGLMKAYEEVVGKEGFFHYPVEEAISEWWGVCGQLRVACEGARSGLLDTDGLDNILLGAKSISSVLGARFQAAFSSALASSASEPTPVKVSNDASSW